jgi:hypothetical protein
MNPSHDFKGKLIIAADRKFPCSTGREAVFAYQRPDGSVSTFYGTPACYLLMDGNQ